MHKPKILVTGATGKTAGAVVKQLRELGFPVRAAVRALDARSERLVALGAEVVVADIFDFEQTAQAMRGVQRAFFCPPFHPHMIHSAAAFAAAAAEAKLESIVGLTQWLSSPSHPSISTRHHWLADRILGMIPDVGLTIVNPGFFGDYPYMAMIPYVANLGIFPLDVDGDGRNAPPSIDDIARVAVGALTDPAKHAGKTYRPTGPELLSIDDMVAIMGRVVGRTVRHVRLPMWMFYKAARMGGASLPELTSFHYYLRAHDAGAFAFGAPTNDVYEVTGRQPEDFESIVRRYVDLPEVKRTLGNTVRTLAQFMTVPFQPGFDPVRYEREHDFPVPPQPLYNMDNPRWKMEHTSPAVATDALVGALRASQGVS
jgi:uncharacterized protein YbjT (DUF2867 family)